MKLLNGRQPFEIARNERYEGGNVIPSRFSALRISLSVAGGRPHQRVDSDSGVRASLHPSDFNTTVRLEVE